MDRREIQVVRVHGSRLDSSKGDIPASYSAYTIAERGRIRNPFRFGKNDWVSTEGVSTVFGPGAMRYEECYRVVEEKEFKKRWPKAGTFSYPGECQGEEGDRRRESWVGWYHGMKVKWGGGKKGGGKEFVLEGPPVRFEEAV